MSKFEPIEDRANLARDPNSTAVVNVDVSAYERAVADYKAAKARQESIDAAVADINNLKSEMSEIKNLLKSLLEKV